MIRLAILFACILSLGTPAASAGAADPRTVFARHDPYGRLPNTEIRKLGAVRVKAVTYDIYYLDFSNPVSLHGLQQIAIIKNGN